MKTIDILISKLKSKNRGLLFFLFIGFLITESAVAQVESNSAIVEFASHDKGVLIPRMTTQERLDIPVPAEGLIVYDNELHTFFYFDGTAWKNNSTTSLSGGIDGSWPLTGFVAGSTNPFLGTTDYTPLIFKTNDIERFRVSPEGIWYFENGLMNAETSEFNLNSLDVFNDVTLNSQGGFTSINGETTLGGPLRNTTYVTGNTQIEKDLFLYGNANIVKNLNLGGVGLVNNFFTVTKTLEAKELVVQEDVVLNANGGTTSVNGESIFGGPLLKQATFKGPVVMEKSLEVADLMVGNTLLVGGPATFKNTILGEGEVSFKDKLNVDGATDLNTTLNVDGASTLKNTLTVDGATDLNTTLNVDGTTRLRSNVTADQSVAIGGNLTVTGVTNLNNTFNVTKNDGGFISTFRNTNGGDGNGINIQLGKAKSSYIIPALPTLISAQQMADIKRLISCELDVNAKINLLTNIVINGALEDIKIIAGLAVSVGNLVVDFINKTIGLPIPFGPIIIPAINFPAIGVPGFTVDVPLIPTFTLPGFTVTNGFQLTPKIPLLPKFDLVPAIPELNLTFLGIPEINIKDLNFWGIPNICLNDGGATPLNNRNEFIRFSDNNNDKMGNIRAESVTDWSNNYLNPAYLFGLYGAITSSKVDKFHAQWHFKGMISTALLSYGKIGVEYTSGNGDYAEWLERTDINEFISPGDIVSVVGGKVTRDLTNAEQVMVVSHNPIVLGNTPPEGQAVKGNNIAFMGQVPVKVMGPVKTGDYIIGSLETLGYGYAKNEKDMTIEDFKHTVGRAWQANEDEGPKMINTVVGVHNGDYLKILQRYEQKFKENESRFDNLESKVNNLINQLTN